MTTKLETTNDATLLKERLERQHGQVWTTVELQKDFEVVGFGAGLCVVRRRSDQALGSLDFTHRPRFYFNFMEHGL
jgi:hypothetical protein